MQNTIAKLSVDEKNIKRFFTLFFFLSNKYLNVHYLLIDRRFLHSIELTYICTIRTHSQIKHTHGIRIKFEKKVMKNSYEMAKSEEKIYIHSKSNIFTKL